jgi:hypothetical protein
VSVAPEDLGRTFKDPERPVVSVALGIDAEWAVDLLKERLSALP